MNNKLIVALTVSVVLTGAGLVLLKVYDRKSLKDTEEEIERLKKDAVNMAVLETNVNEAQRLIHDYVNSVEKRTSVLEEFYENFQKLTPEERKQYLKVINGTI